MSIIDPVADIDRDCNVQRMALDDLERIVVASGAWVYDGGLQPDRLRGSFLI